MNRCVSAAQPARPRLKRAHAEYGLELLSRLKARLFTLLLRPGFGACGKGVVVCPPLRFANLRYFHLGDGVIVHRDCWIHVLSGKDEPKAPRLVIQAQTGIGMGSTISVAKEVVLGKFVMLARNVYISDNRHAFEDVETPISAQGIAGVSPVRIDDETWLGQNVCVLPGVHIGRHSVIGANSVVTRDIPDFSVAVGSPARVIKHYDAKSKTWVQ